jgi:hypothetical protein
MKMNIFMKIGAYSSGAFQYGDLGPFFPKTEPVYESG